MIPPPRWDSSLCGTRSECLPAYAGRRPLVVGVFKEVVG